MAVAQRDARPAADHHADAGLQDAAQPPVDDDPVCGAEVRLDRGPISVLHRGWTYRFCSVECRDIFQENRAEFGGAPRFLLVRFLWWLTVAIARDAGPKRTALFVGGLACTIAVWAIFSADTAWWLLTGTWLLVGFLAWLERVGERPRDAEDEAERIRLGDLSSMLVDWLLSKP